MQPTNRSLTVTPFRPTQPATQPAINAREWPTLTIYRDGMVNLNALATELLRAAEYVALVAPPPVQRGRLPNAAAL